MWYSELRIWIYIKQQGIKKYIYHIWHVNNKSMGFTTILIGDLGMYYYI